MIQLCGIKLNKPKVKATFIYQPEDKSEVEPEIAEQNNESEAEAEAARYTLSTVLRKGIFSQPKTAGMSGETNHLFSHSMPEPM